LTQSGSAFEWLKDPLAIGLNSTEIVDLLFEESEQSPWICYELVLPATHDTTVIDFQPDYIQPALSGRYGDPFVKISEVEVKRKISELCGLGGIIPTPGDRMLWTENAIIRSSARSATSSYGYDAEWVRSEPFAKARIEWICKVLESCSGALDRFVKLFRWLQSHELVDDHIVIFKINPVNQVEAVQIPLELVTKLKQCVTELAPRSEALGPVRALGAATFNILRLLFLPIDEPSEDMESIIHKCALAVQALCLAMLSSSQAHIGRIDPFFREHYLSEVILDGAYDSLMKMLAGYRTTSGKHHYQLVNLTCAGDMIGSKVMVFAERFVDHDEKFDLFIAPEDLLSLWGPGTLIPYSPFGPDYEPSAEWLCGIAIRGGIIYKPLAHSGQMHWKAGTADDVRKDPFQWNLKTKMTIGAILVKKYCLTEPGPQNTVLRPVSKGGSS
jgi:hypothetical protein